MKVIEIDGDLVDLLLYVEYPTTVIGHQTNVFGVMGAGVAVGVKNTFPTVFTKYQTLCKSYAQNPEELLGKTQVLSTEYPDIYVANLFGQAAYGKDNRQTNYEAIYTSLETLRTILKDHEVLVSFPVGMSSGLAGGNWSIIKTMILEVFKDSNCTLMFVNYAKKS